MDSVRWRGQGTEIGSQGASGVHKVMTSQGDPLVGLGAHGGAARVREPGRGWRSDGAAAAFWAVVGLVPLLLSVAWVWYGFAFHEEMTEQGKAAASGDTMAGSGLAYGGMPLIIAHLLVLVPLLVLGAKYHPRRAVGIAIALIAPAAASVLGIAVAQWLWRGLLFTMYADATGHFVP